MLDASYVLPLRSSSVVEDLDDYLEELARHVEVLVIDGSPAEIFELHHRRWTPTVRHLAVDRDLVSPMGKVGGVLTGVRHAGHRAVVIGDDDVRWDRDLLVAALGRLPGHAVVRPQNVFRPTPWHARWDTGRILLNRFVGGDWPGTLVVDGDMLMRAGGYDGSVMFENLELVRTLRANGGGERLALDVIVPRRPPPIHQFLGQRVRQAYDEFARPWRLVMQLAVAPTVLLGGRRAAAVIASVAIMAAEAGRRRGGGRRVFPASAALWAPAWVGERAVTSWIAVWRRLGDGGISYHGSLLRSAATPMSELRRQRISSTVAPLEDVRRGRS